MAEPISERRWNELQTLAWSPIYRPPEGTPERVRHDAFCDAVGEAKRLRGLARSNWAADRALMEILAEHRVMMREGEFGGMPKLLTDLMQWGAVTVESETCWLREELDGVRTELADLQAPQDADGGFEHSVEWAHQVVSVDGTWAGNEVVQTDEQAAHMSAGIVARMVDPATHRVNVVCRDVWTRVTGWRKADD